MSNKTLVRRTKEDARQTREQIMSAAAQVFCEKSFANTTLEDIADKAKVTRGAIYWHFKNKADIFEALHQQHQCPLLEMISQNSIEDHPLPLDHMQESCTKLLFDLEEDIQKRKLLTLFMQACDYSGELKSLKETHAKKQKEHLKAFVNYFEKAKLKHAHLKKLDSEILAQSISYYMKGIIIEYLNDPENLKMRDRAPALMESFFNGIKS